MIRRARDSLLVIALGLVLMVLEGGLAAPGPRPFSASEARPSAPASLPSGHPRVVDPGPTAMAGPSGSLPTTLAPNKPVPLLRRSPEGVVPILYYHRVEAVPHGFAKWPKHARDRFLRYDTLPAALDAQLDWLKSHGYTTILPRDLAAHWDHRAALPRRPVILTFDDGSSSWASFVLPALRARGMVAEFYLTLDAIRAGTISWAQVRRLAAAGNGIGAHDVHHVQLVRVPGRRDASAERMWHEVHDVRSVIARHVGVAPDSMAYVGGGFNAELERLVRRSGYTTARSIVRGVRQQVAHRYMLKVVRIGALDDVLDPVAGRMDLTMSAFASRVAGREPRRRSAPAART